MYHSTPRQFAGRKYWFEPFLGWLRSQKYQSSPITVTSLSLPEKAKSCLKYVENPYLIIPRVYSKRERAKAGKIISAYAHILVWLHAHFYPGLWLLSYLRLKIFENSEEAINTFCDIIPENQKVLCLPRSIFAATLSKRFKKHGVMVIGAFLPTHLMHAFIIEDGRNPFTGDFAWINYSPITVMT